MMIEHRALAYDHAQAAAKMRRAGLPEEYRRRARQRAMGQRRYASHGRA